MLLSNAFYECITGSTLIGLQEGNMPIFEVRIKQKCTRYAVEEIDATDWEEAEAIAWKKYFDGKIEFENDNDELSFEAEELNYD